MSVLIESLEKVVGRNRGTEEKSAFWVGHSRFQVSKRVLDYRGKAEALVLVYLYQRAEHFSFYSDKPIVIEIPVREEMIAEKTGLNRDTVSQAIISLEADSAIKVSRRRDPITKQVVTSVYLVLHGQTGGPLLSSPGIWGVCEQNLDIPYIVAPKETLGHLKSMTPTARHIYLCSLRLASREYALSFRVNRDEWRAETRLGRNAFDRGVKECAKKKLLSYDRYVLTLHDPRTGEPSQRQRHEFVRHEDARYRGLDFRDITAAEWQRVIQRLLQREFTISESGWTHTRPDNICPFCKEGRSFTVNFNVQRFKCHACQHGGKLGQLVQQRLREPKWARVRQYVREVIDATKTVAEAHAEI